MSLPSLAGLRLGPPTGPMAVYGIPTYPGDEDDDRETNPSASKQRRGADGQSLPGLVVYKPEEGNPVDPITQEPFTPGQMVYKTPEDGVNYDPHALYILWSMNRAEGRATVDGTTNKVLPESEFDGLSEWVQKNAKPPSPQPSPIRPDQVFKNPIVDGKEFVQREQPPVDPMEGMVPAERARLNPREWRHLNYADIDDLVRVLRQSSVIDYFRIATILRSWLDALQWYYENQLLQGSFSDLRWSSGSARGKVDISWIITHNLLPGSAEGVVERNYIHVRWSPWTQVVDDNSEFRAEMLGALLDGLNPKNSSGPVSDTLLSVISAQDFSCMIGPLGRSSDEFQATVKISPRLLAAFICDKVLADGGEYPTNEWLAQNHYGFQPGEQCAVPYSPDWSEGENVQQYSSATLQHARENWTKMVARILSMLYNFEIRTSAHEYATGDDRTQTLRLVAPVQYVDGSGYSMGRLAPSPETALAEYLSIVNAEHDWDDVMTYEEGGQRTIKYYFRELSVPFWLSEDVARVPLRSEA